MRTSKIAGFILAGMLAIAPVTFAGGFGDVRLPGGHFNAGGSATTSAVKSNHPGFSANLYAPSSQSRAPHWYIGPYWWGYPFGLAVFEK